MTNLFRVYGHLHKEFEAADDRPLRQWGGVSVPLQFTALSLCGDCSWRAIRTKQYTYAYDTDASQD